MFALLKSPAQYLAGLLLHGGGVDDGWFWHGLYTVTQLANCRYGCRYVTDSGNLSVRTSETFPEIRPRQECFQDDTH